MWVNVAEFLVDISLQAESEIRWQVGSKRRNASELRYELFETYLGTKCQF